MSRSHSQAKILDLDVRWRNFSCRAVRFWHAEEQRYLTWLTNLPRDQYPASDVMQLYRLRWQIELLFKEWKIHNNLRRFATQQRHLAEGLIWASLLSFMVKRIIGRTTQRAKKVSFLSTLKIAKVAGIGSYVCYAL
ncbi:transposase [Ferrimonas pelagia]|uniref:transposase n=1 Tax=Ferrimonas pelagia TaxID=1177826 RepID=UPI003CD09A69